MWFKESARKYKNAKALPAFDQGLGLIMNSLSLFFLLLLLLLLLHNFFQLSNKFGHGAGRQALRSWNIQKGIRRGAIFNFGQRRPAGGRGAGRGGAGAGAGGGTGVKGGPAQQGELDGVQEEEGEGCIFAKACSFS